MLDNHGFDMWADGYDKSVDMTDENNLYPFAGYKKLMNSIFGTVMKKCPASILDLGIGTGTLSHKLYEKGNEITGLDFSNEMLNHSRAKMPNARLIKCDFSNGLPSELNGTKFDFIISTYALHHLEDTKKAEFIRELLTHINEDGSILIGDVSFSTRDDLEKCKEACATDGWDEDEFYFVFLELYARLRGNCDISYHQYSHCSGVLEIRPLHNNQLFQCSPAAQDEKIFH